MEKLLLLKILAAPKDITSKDVFENNFTLNDKNVICVKPKHLLKDSSNSPISFKFFSKFNTQL